MEEIIRTIRNYRKKKKYTQAKIASILGITTRSYSKIENGQTNLTIERLYEITDILDIHLIHFFNEKPIYRNNTKNINKLEHPSVSLIKQYQEAIDALQEQNKLLQKLLIKQS